MQIDPDNKVIKLCAAGMEYEGMGKKSEAAQAFQQAWDVAVNDSERFISAHYIARHQPSIAKKLEWDQTALQLALTINDENTKSALPSMYLNIGKCYEDLGDFVNANINYKLALSFTNILQADGYGTMIKSGIMHGIDRTSILLAGK